MQRLAENVGLSHTPCWRRYTRKEELGVIVKKVVVVDAEKIGKGLNALCTAVLKHHDEKTLIAFE